MLTNYKSNYTSTMYMKVNTSLCMRIANQREDDDTVIFYPKVHLVATKLVPVEISSEVAAGPLASGDPQVTLSHVECLPKALALNLAEPLVSLQVSLYKSCSSWLPRGEHNTPHNPSLEHRTIFLHALTEPQASKPSRRWQPPKVKSTTDLQDDHLVPLDATS